MGSGPVHWHCDKVPEGSSEENRKIARIHLRPPSLAEAGVPSVGAGPEPENVRKMKWKMGARSGFERAGIFAADRGDAVDGGVEGG